MNRQQTAESLLSRALPEVSDDLRGEIQTFLTTRPGRGRPSSVNRDLVKQLHSQGCSIAEICLRLAVSHATVYKALK